MTLALVVAFLALPAQTSLGAPSDLRLEDDGAVAASPLPAAAPIQKEDGEKGFVRKDEDGNRGPGHKPLAASYVSSKEWMMRRAPVKEEEFTGDVKYWTYSRFVRADWALYRHDDETWAARGNIRGEHTLPRGRGVFEVFGEKALFDQKRRKGTLTGKKGYVDVVLTGSGNVKDYGRAGRMVWELERTVSLLDGVRLWGERVDAWSDRADYDWEKASMTLTGGRPVLSKKFGEWTTAIKADTIVAMEDDAPEPKPGAAKPRSLLANGAVRGWLEFKNKQVPSLEP